MLKELFHYIYCMSIPSTMFILVLACCLWNYFSSKFNQKKIWTISNIILFAVWLFCIMYMTVLIRGSIAKMNFIPFRFIYEPFRTGNEEFFRVGWMNILLFVPGGMWLSYGLGKQTKTKRILQIMFLMIISITIETLQWYFKRGTVEIDDVICNTFGAIVGVTAPIWAFKIVEFVKPIIMKVFEHIKNLVQNIINEIKLIIKKT